MDTLCWICGAVADSAEHRIKKSDLIRAHGRGPYKGPSALGHYRAGKETTIQGPGAKAVKYSPSLCHRCNTAYTQPFDRAYDQFVGWIMENEETVLRRRFVDFVDVFGDVWAESQCDLYKYFAKSFGCRLVEADTVVPGDIVDLFGKTMFSTALRLSIAVNEDVLLMPATDRDGFIGKGELIAWADRQAPSSPNSFTWDEHVSWLTICYWYNYEPDGAYGATWVADNRYVYLGSFAPFSNEMRAAFIEKVKNRGER